MVWAGLSTLLLSACNIQSPYDISKDLPQAFPLSSGVYVEGKEALWIAKTPDGYDLFWPNVSPGELLRARLFRAKGYDGFVVQAFVEEHTPQSNYTYALLKPSQNGFVIYFGPTRAGYQQIIDSSFLNGSVQRFSAPSPDSYVSPTITPTRPRDTVKLLIELVSRRIALGEGSNFAFNGERFLKADYPNCSSNSPVCRNSELQAKDRQLMERYGLVASKADRARIQVLRAEQQAWSKQLKACSKDDDACVSRAYDERLAVLNKLAPRSAVAEVVVPPSQNPAEDCNSTDPQRIIIGCTAIIEKGGLNDRDKALAYSRRSDANMKARTFDRAIADRKKALDLQPDDPTYKLRLSGAYQVRAEAVANSNRNAAIEDLTEAIRIDPTNTDARLQRSAQYASQDKLDAAIQDAETAVKGSGESSANTDWLSSLLVWRAAQLLQSADLARAIELLNKATQVPPKKPELLVLRANAYAARGDYGLAIADYSDALSLKPDYVDALLYRGEMYSRTGQLTRGLSDYDAAIKLDSKNVNALLARAVAREINGQFEGAAQDYARVVALDSKDTVAKEGMVRAKQEQEASVRLEKLSREQASITEITPAKNAALSPTFNCDKVSAPDELAICDNRALAFLDRELSAAYQQLKKGLQRNEDNLRLKQEQGEWLRQRRQCQRNSDCIAEVYRSRIEQLQSWQPMRVQME
ncbi:tetratricopeptide repeat protein [Bradyrhizobium sp. CCBAU 53338]|uniref:tetratricopeptide repeat protein n=1 Tax=Bradyrhizobium sp. CCBAU 53338 TaxID=1325111 RepID=UPI00188D20C9|nr:tetratricopeptide repeat protein [Bradyrhizobium sp. CCBAU 53338]